MTKLLLLVCFYNQAHENYAREKNFYLNTLQEVLEIITPAEKQEIIARLEEIERLDKEIKRIHYYKKTHQFVDLLIYNTLADSINHYPKQKQSK